MAHNFSHESFPLVSKEPKPRVPLRSGGTGKITVFNTETGLLEVISSKGKIDDKFEHFEIFDNFDSSQITEINSTLIDTPEGDRRTALNVHVETEKKNIADQASADQARTDLERGERFVRNIFAGLEESEGFDFQGLIDNIAIDPFTDAMTASLIQQASNSINKEFNKTKESNRQNFGSRFGGSSFGDLVQAQISGGRASALGAATNRANIAQDQSNVAANRDRDRLIGDLGGLSDRFDLGQDAQRGLNAINEARLRSGSAAFMAGIDAGLPTEIFDVLGTSDFLSARDLGRQAITIANETLDRQNDPLKFGLDVTSIIAGLFTDNRPLLGVSQIAGLAGSNF